MTCDRVRARITAYLDGELDDASASALRGHLRLCEACRALAGEHAALVGALTELAPPEPPPAMWDGVLARLGDAEIADAGRSRLALWWRRIRPQLAPALALAGAAAVAALWIAHRRGDDAGRPSVAAAPRLAAPEAAPAPHPPAPPAVATAGHVVDVAEDVAGDDARVDASYRAAADDLIALAADARGGWPAAQARGFDARVATLRAAIDHAGDRAARERAWQDLIDYVQRAVVGVQIAEAP